MQQKYKVLLLHMIWWRQEVLLLSCFSRVNPEKSSCFLEHQCFMSQCFSLLLCLPPFHTILYLLNLFCAFFLPVPLITPCIVFVDCFNACDYISVRQISCTVHLHAYVIKLKKGMLWCKKHSHCLLNPSTHIT